MESYTSFSKESLKIGKGQLKLFPDGQTKVFINSVLESERNERLDKKIEFYNDILEGTGFTEELARQELAELGASSGLINFIVELVFTDVAMNNGYLEKSLPLDKADRVPIIKNYLSKKIDRFRITENSSDFLLELDLTDIAEAKLRGDIAKLELKNYADLDEIINQLYMETIRLGSSAMVLNASPEECNNLKGVFNKTGFKVDYQRREDGKFKFYTRLD